MFSVDTVPTPPLYSSDTSALRSVDLGLFLHEYQLDLSRCLKAVPPAQFVELVTSLEGAWRAGKMVLLCGNGGSAATASHIANDFQKGLAEKSGRGLKALALTDSTSILTTYGNDYGYPQIFGPQVELWAPATDVLIAISGSGNSANVLEAVDMAKRYKIKTIALTGMGGGKLAPRADLAIIVESFNMQQIEDVTISILHAAFSALRDVCSQ